MTTPQAPEPDLAVRQIAQEVIDADEACLVAAQTESDRHRLHIANTIYQDALRRFHAYVPAGTVLDLLDRLTAAEARLAGARKVREAVDKAKDYLSDTDLDAEDAANKAYLALVNAYVPTDAGQQMGEG